MYDNIKCSTQMSIFFHLSNYPQNNCIFEMRSLKKEEESLSNSFVPKTFQATKLNLYKVYIHIFTEKCSHTGIEETFNLKIHFIYDGF